VQFAKPVNKVSWEQFKLLNNTENNWFKNRTTIEVNTSNEERKTSCYNWRHK
jgi:hypothetical protein